MALAPELVIFGHASKSVLVYIGLAMFPNIPMQVAHNAKTRKNNAKNLPNFPWGGHLIECNNRSLLEALFGNGFSETKNGPQFVKQRSIQGLILLETKHNSKITFYLNHILLWLSLIIYFIASRYLSRHDVLDIYEDFVLSRCFNGTFPRKDK